MLTFSGKPLPMLPRTLFLLGLLTTSLFLNAQGLSPMARVSLLTCAPGVELYSAFGHSAIRIQDPATDLDKVYNYGTFDFNTPNFYVKFMRGKLNYMLNADSWREFEYVYRYLDRSYEEQLLSLSPEQVEAVYRYLETNYQPENRYYLYDFFFDNCATRIRDVFETTLGEELQWGQPAQSGASFRDYLHQYLTEKAWVEFGIDLALGAVVDRTATVREQMFLPDYLAEAFQGAQVGDAPFVTNRQSLYEGGDNVQPTTWWLHPLTISCLLLLLMGAVSWRFREQSLRGLDSALFSILGLAGLILFLLWFATDHTATAQNWNLLWAQPLHLLAAVLIWVPATYRWLYWYFLFVAGLAVLLLLSGAFLPQDFPLAAYPIFALIALRAYLRARKLG